MKKVSQLPQNSNKRLVWTSVVLLLLVTATYCPSVYADNKGLEQTEKELWKNIDDQLELLNLDELEDYLNNIDDSILADSSVISIVRDILEGELATNTSDLLTIIADIVLRRFYRLLPSLVIIIVVASLLGIVVNNKKSSILQSTSQTVYFVCYGVIIISVLTATYDLILTTSKTVENIAKLTNLTLPILLTLMTVLGGNAVLSAYKPAVALLSGGVINIINQVILPLVTYSMVFCVISNISDTIKLNKLTKFFQNISNTIIGIVFTVFTAFMSVKGINGAVADSVSLRTVKFATRNYIPILGGYLADSIDLIMASSVMIKNSLGVVSLLLLLATILAPVMQILAYSLGLQLICAVTEPITDSRIIAFLNQTSKSLTVLIVCILAVSFMLFLVIMLIISTANIIY